MIDLPYEYWPSRCLKCGDETKSMRHKFLKQQDGGRCRLKTPKGTCRGKVVFLLAPEIKPRMTKAKAIEIAGDYDVQLELDRLASSLGRPEKED